MIEVYRQNVGGVWFGVACAQRKIVATSFSTSEQSTLSNLLAIIPYNQPFQVLHEPSALAKDALMHVKKVFDGDDVNESPALAFEALPAYTQKVLKATLKVPVGFVTSYGEIAKTVGGGPRAVGNVMASNPFAPIVPCHRVVKSDFRLGGYGGGLKVKVEFLEREKRGFTDSKNIRIRGKSLQVFPTECALRNLDIV